MSDLHWPMSCPFCGRFPVMVSVQIPHPGMSAMRCQGCGAQGPPRIVPGDAAKAWDEIHYRRRMTDRDVGSPGDDDDPPPRKPITPKLPVTA